MAQETAPVVGFVHTSSLKEKERLPLLQLVEADGALGRVYLAERKQIHILLQIHGSGVT